MTNINEPTCDLCEMSMADKVVPVHTDGHTLCPQCFVWHHAPAHTDRWHWDSLSANCCKKCGYLSVDYGRKTCAHCNSNMLRVLGSH